METKEDNKLGTGYIEKACRTLGVTRAVYYKAKKNLAQGNQLSAIQIDVLAKHQELIKIAKENLEAIKDS